MPAPGCIVVPDGNCAPPGICGMPGICSCEVNSHWPGFPASARLGPCTDCAASLALAVPARPAAIKPASDAVMQSLVIALPSLHALGMVGLAVQRLRLKLRSPLAPPLCLGKEP